MRVRLTGIVVLLLAAVFTSALVAGAAQAASPHRGELRLDDDDKTIAIEGKLTDTREDPPAPVPGVAISVSDESGKVVGTGTSDKQGAFSIKLPGSSFDNLGKTFVIHIDTDTLPSGSVLRNPDQVSLKKTLTLEEDIFITFPIGEDPNPPVSKWTQGLQLAVGGIVFSLILALAALGLSMIFGTTGLVNFAHGELITFGALVAFAVDGLHGDIEVGGFNITIYVGVVAAFVLGGVFGLLQDRSLWRPLRKRGTGIVAMMIISIGLSIFLRNVFQYFAGAESHNYTQYTSPTPWEIGPILITPKDVAVSALAAVVLVAVCLALQKTQLGKATRAVADNPALAASSGINVERVISVVWIGGASLAGLSGVLLGLTQGFDYQVGFKILLLVFAAVVLGGLGTIWGALVGSFVIGIFIEVSTLVVPVELKFVGALAVLIIVLLFRPQGLLGRAERIG